MEKTYTLVLSERVYCFLKDLIEYASGNGGAEFSVDERLLTDVLIEVCNAKENV